MSIQEFIQAFEESLELPPGRLQPETRLTDIDRYDSMGRLSIMSMVDTKLRIVLDAGAMDQCQTVADLHGLIQKGG